MQYFKIPVLFCFKTKNPYPPPIEDKSEETVLPGSWLPCAWPVHEAVQGFPVLAILFLTFLRSTQEVEAGRKGPCLCLESRGLGFSLSPSVPQGIDWVISLSLPQFPE